MGSNAEIAEPIAAVLRQAGLEAEVVPAREARDLAPYDAVVLGSALYAAHWRRDAHRYVARGRGAADRSIGASPRGTCRLPTTCSTSWATSPSALTTRSAAVSTRPRPRWT